MSFGIRFARCSIGASMARILLIEASSIIRQGLKQIAQSTPDVTVSAEAISANCAHELAQSCEWDLLILGISLPSKSGLDLLKEWRLQYPHRPILAFSLHPDEHLALRALKAGAKGYLSVDSTEEEVLTAIRKVIAGGKYITAAIAEKMATELTIDDASLYRTLSDREYEVFCLLATGKTVSQIAKQLILSVKTVSTYRTRILEKVHLKNNAQIMQYAITRGVIKVNCEMQPSPS
jgi:DNA-binding NarL/FixJ family response regulator